MTEWEALANAIIEQASKDYRAAQRKLRKDPFNEKAQKTIWEVEMFFNSNWFKALTSVSGPVILKQLKEEFNA